MEEVSMRELTIKEAENGFIVQTYRAHSHAMGTEHVFETPAGLSKFILEYATIAKAEMKRKAKEVTCSD
jgi:hypothetical protein